MRKRKGVKRRARSDTSSKARKTIARKTKRASLPKTRNGNTLTEAEFFQKIRYSLRKAFRFWNPMLKALKNASRPSQSANKKLKFEYQCAECKEWFPRTQVQIDHIIPCGSLNNYNDLVPFLKNLTQEDPKSYQILCKKHHKEKTAQEKEDRKIKSAK